MVILYNELYTVASCWTIIDTDFVTNKLFRIFVKYFLFNLYLANVENMVSS